MSSIAYVVAAGDEGWSLRHQGYSAGTFASRDEALREAIDLAREASGCGHEARVLVQDRDGGQQEAWRRERSAAA
jgi:hypothetical protein